MIVQLHMAITPSRQRPSAMFEAAVLHEAAMGRPLPPKRPISWMVEGHRKSSCTGPVLFRAGHAPRLIYFVLLLYGKYWHRMLPPDASAPRI
jgi:hypothetical protein